MAEEAKTNFVKPRTGKSVASGVSPGMGGGNLAPGAKIRQYEIIRELGRGGMGVVYLARDTKLARRVAIKFLVAESRDLIDGFLREARATAACHHENIVVIHEVDEHAGVPYMVLEYLEGQSLRTFIKGRQLPPQRAVELMVPVARALARAHQLGIVHRDLKPENIFVTTSGTIKVLDFGIAALFADAGPPLPKRPPPLPGTKPPLPPARAPVKAPPKAPPAPTPGLASLADSSPGGETESHTYTGTLPYMAPEQFDAANVDARADLWAFGVMLWEILGGHHPVQPLDSDALWRNAMQLDTPMPKIGEAAPGIPHKLQILVEKCLQKRADKRAATAAEVLAELESMLPGRTLRASSGAVEASPYPGLVAFQEDEADRFFGRGRDVLQVVARLREQPIVAVIGPSGVGKSSFVRAGVVPGLKASGERWEAYVLRPGRQPLNALATMLQPLQVTGSRTLVDKMAEHSSLVKKLIDEPGYLGATLRARAATGGHRILVFVDQFEELYTLVPDEEQRRAFVACLSGCADDAAAPLRVLASLRSDFLDRVGADRRFAEELARGLVLLQPLGREQLREALTAPVEQLGYGFESPAMVDDMVQALASTPGALPLLQFAGTKLWQARDRTRKVLTQASYEQMGGISGVLAQHADEVVMALPATLQRLVRGLFQRLVTSDGTRAIVEVSELYDLGPDPREVRALVDNLVQARLLVVQSRGDEETATVELVHESLITRWPLLRRWLDEGRDDGAFREQLRTAAKQWDGRGRPEGLLWRGEAMEEARLWRARHVDPLPDREEDFLRAVLALATRATRIRRAAALGTIAFLSLVVALGAIAFVGVRSAEKHAVAEAERARAAEAQVKAQLDAVQRAELEKMRARGELRGAKEDLATANARLEAALRESELERKKADEAAAQAQRLAASLQRTNAQLEKLLADARARAEKLERERRKITTELR